MNGGTLSQGGIGVKMEDGNASVCRSGPMTTNTAAKFEPGMKMEPADSSADAEKPSTSSGEAATESKAVAKPSKKVFTVEELKAALLPIWDKLERMDDAIPFRVPVDPDLLGIPVRCSERL